MTARDDVLRAAQELRSRGKEPFSPAELIAEARRQGSAYKDGTLRTHVVGVMCENAADHWAVKYGDLRRVGRGRYQLVVAADDRAARKRASASDVPTSLARSTSASPEREGSSPSEPQSAMHEWSWEGNVQAAVVTHLAAAGWSIKRVADTSSGEQGVDIEATRDGERLVVEVKGYPSATYVRGPNAGRPKPTSAPLQARHYFGNALLSAMLMRTDHPSARVALAFPERETYRTLAMRTLPPLTRAGIEIWLVGEDGLVEEIAPATASDPNALGG